MRSDTMVMSSPSTSWFCCHCEDGPFSHSINAFCPSCQRRRCDYCGASATSVENEAGCHPQREDETCAEPHHNLGRGLSEITNASQTGTPLQIGRSHDEAWRRVSSKRNLTFTPSSENAAAGFVHSGDRKLHSNTIGPAELEPYSHYGPGTLSSNDLEATSSHIFAYIASDNITSAKFTDLKLGGIDLSLVSGSDTSIQNDSVEPKGPWLQILTSLDHHLSDSKHSLYRNENGFTDRRKDGKRGYTQDTESHEKEDTNATKKLKVIDTWSSHNDEDRLLACHYSKMDSRLHSSCIQKRFKAINYVMQHLRDKHNLSRNELPGMSKAREAHAEKWYWIWDKLFPGRARPSTPYADDFQMVEHYIQFFGDQLLPALISKSGSCPTQTDFKLALQVGLNLWKQPSTCLPGTECHQKPISLVSSPENTEEHSSFLTNSSLMTEMLCFPSNNPSTKPLSQERGSAMPAAVILETRPLEQPDPQKPRLCDNSPTTHLKSEQTFLLTHGTAENGHFLAIENTRLASNVTPLHIVDGSHSFQSEWDDFFHDSPGIDQNDSHENDLLVGAHSSKPNG